MIHPRASLLAIIASLCFAVPLAAEAPPTAPVEGIRTEVFQLPAPRAAAAGPDNQYLTGALGEPLAGILYTPARGDNRYGPALLFVDEGPGSHPENPLTASRFAAQRLAAKGYTTLSILPRMNRGFMLDRFEDSALDIRVAIDWLEANGHEDIVLVGHGMGGMAIAYYMAHYPDANADLPGGKRVKAAIYFAPPSDRFRLETGLADEGLYQRMVATAQANVAAGKGGGPDLSPDPDKTKGLAPDPVIAHYPYLTSSKSFLDYHGPDSNAVLGPLLSKETVPLLLLGGSTDAWLPDGRLEALKAAATASPRVDVIRYEGIGHSFEGAFDRSAEDIARWLDQNGLGVKPYVTTEVVATRAADGQYLPGTLYTPAAGIDPTKPAILLQHGMMGDNLQSAAQWLAWRLAQAGYAVLSPNVRWASPRGFQQSDVVEAGQDVGSWMDYLETRGMKRVVIEGHSLGGIMVSGYMASSQDPRAVGLIFLAPTRDLSKYAVDGMGKAAYAKLVKEARTAVAKGEGNSHVINYKQYVADGAPGQRFGVQQFARGWLGFAGPGPRGSNTTQVASIKAPGLIFWGTADGLMTPEFIGEMKAAYKGKVEVVTIDKGSHGFRESKNLVADRTVDWLKRTYP
ncbi:alpha/beta hydrolase family protein [Novosphingobium sp. BL-52-GroH]|uniref:alpha/beta hydrolase family protein n=1 Tax=Novosphingobium sp. BL-52-GroH TaxID=3349877 RepID=UPI00384AEBF0